MNKKILCFTLSNLSVVATRSAILNIHDYDPEVVVLNDPEAFLAELRKYVAGRQDLFVYLDENAPPDILEAMVKLRCRYGVLETERRFGMRVLVAVKRVDQTGSCRVWGSPYFA